MQLFDVYSLYPIEPVKGRGCHVYTADGTEYLDLYGGHAVISIGHCHPHYVEAVSRQVAELGFYSNSVVNSQQQRLATLLGEACGYDDYNLFLCNSGAEANENALKLASFHTGRDRILAFGGAFHGRTSGAVAVTDNAAIRAPYNQAQPVDFCPLGDLEKAQKMLSSRRYAAAIIEGIQGVAGIRVPDDAFMRGLRDVCTTTGTVLVCDEIQSGYGRTGRFFAHQWAGIRADVVTCAKGIANGFPMGAVIISPAFVPRKSMLGTTFGGSHLACAAAIAVLEVMKDENLVANAGEVGTQLLKALKALPGLKDVRGRGLMVGLDLPEEVPAADMRRSLIFDRHIFTGGAGPQTVRLLPPLCMSHDEAQFFIKQFTAQLSMMS